MNNKQGDQIQFSLAQGKRLARKMKIDLSPPFQPIISVNRLRYKMG